MTNKIALARVPPEGYIQWAHNYNVPSGNISITGLNPLASGGYLASCDYWLPTDYGSSTWLTRVNSAGEMPGCNTDDNISIGIRHISLPFANETLVGSDIPPNIQPYSLSVTNAFPVAATVCSGQDVCTALQVDPHNAVCGLGDTVTFTATRGSSCTLAVDWSYDTAAAKTASSGVSSISLVFKKTGSFQLTGSLSGSCQPLQGATSFQVYDSPARLDLGPDQVLCPNATDTLHAGKNYASYIWQDGSTDSIYRASTPGNYSVTATNYCNQQYTDAIQVLPATAYSFDLGNDITICPGDTATLQPPAGFNNYSWSPGYNAFATAPPSLAVYPAKDTNYTCKALTQQGCPVIDSVRINLAPVQPIDLGNVLNFCPDGQLRLDAGGGFSSYLWTTGATSRQITVGQPGQYSVQATNTNRCLSRASVTITPYPVSKPALGADIGLCTDSTHTFDAGKGYTKYLWQDGSTQPTLTVTRPGEYWVQVTDANGCPASDTVVVSGKEHCLTGIYFPNAFSPNGDGKNDSFKPIFGGSLDLYQLMIYDRFGELVFESNDPARGWDGRYNHFSKPNSTFVWYARYHFAGSADPPVLQKGTLVLVR